MLRDLLISAAGGMRVDTAADIADCDRPGGHFAHDQQGPPLGHIQCSCDAQDCADLFIAPVTGTGTS
jgi:hypothetical protein